MDGVRRTGVVGVGAGVNGDSSDDSVSRFDKDGSDGARAGGDGWTGAGRNREGAGEECW